MNIIKITLNQRIIDSLEVTITINDMNPFQCVKPLTESLLKDIPSFFNFIKEEIFEHLNLDRSEQVRMNNMLDSLQRQYMDKLNPNPSISEAIYIVVSE